MLHKWKCSESAFAKHIPSHHLDKKTSQEITCTYAFTKVLGVEWDADSDIFCSMISAPSSVGLTNRTLLSVITRLHDILSWCYPALIKPKIMLQRLGECGIGWNHPVSRVMRETWERWCGELPLLCGHLIPRTYFPREVEGYSMQLHGFCDASESAYAGVVYLRAGDQDGLVHVSLIMAKTKVSPI